ncbi:hypothetical protein Tco_0510704 [Tanacetum coccineum]
MKSKVIIALYRWAIPEELPIDTNKLHGIKVCKDPVWEAIKRPGLERQSKEYKKMQKQNKRLLPEAAI